MLQHVGEDNYEFIEILGEPRANYGVYTLVLIDGDAGRNPGEIYRTYPVGESNPAGYWTTGFRTGEMRNGSNTLLLVRNYRGSLGMDLDAGNGGTLNSTPWATVVDSIAVSRGAPGDRTYADVTLFPNIDGNPAMVSGASRIPNGVNTHSANDWLRNNFDGDGLGCPECRGVASRSEAVNTPNNANRPGTGTPTPTYTPTGTVTPIPIDTSIPANCRDIIINGNFESADAWKFGESPTRPRYTSDQHTSGLRSVLLGHPAGGGSMDVAAYSSIRQKVMIPADATVAYLTWNHFSLTQEAVLSETGRHGDRQEYILLAPNGMTIGVEYRKLLNNSGWATERRDLTNFIGKNLNIYFNVYNNGNNLRTWMYLDDVRLIVCWPEGVTPGAAFVMPTPMPLPTDGPTASPTVTPTWTGTSSPTPTSTPTTDPSGLLRRDDAPTPNALLDATAAPRASATVTPTFQPAPVAADSTTSSGRVPPNCVELVSNGTFEQTSVGWTLEPGAGMPAYTQEVTFGGSNQAMRVGNIDELNLSSLSRLKQTIDLPENYASIVLAYAYYPMADGEPGQGGDLQYIDVYNAYTDQFIQRALSAERNDRTWLFDQVDLTRLKGQPIRLVIAVNNDGVGGRIAMYVDNISILACDRLAESDAPPVITVPPTLAALTPTLAGPPAATSTTNFVGLGRAETSSWRDQLGTMAVLAGILVVIALLVWAALATFLPNQRDN